MRILPADFYARSTAEVARELLGKVLEVGETRGIIVEVEAYLGRDDPASHAFARITPRNRLMYEVPGRAYIYFSYGNHWCMNAVAHDGVAGAVLLRAVQPWQGTTGMAKRRHATVEVADPLPPEAALQRLPAAVRNLTSGPGKLTQAVGIGPEHNGHALQEKPLRILDGGDVLPPFDIATGPRVGISRAVDWPLRFWCLGNPFVSAMKGGPRRQTKTG
ncbi:MAG: DNA-3-methyladenine glycosylase [Candidatus Xenobia bacterium]